MRWQLSDEQQAYREALGDWLGSVASPDAVRAWLEAEDSTTFWSLLTDAGWGGVGIGEDHGGQGGGLVELALTAEAFGGTAVPSAPWLAGVLVAPVLGYTDETSAVLIPAGRRPGTAGLLALDSDGKVSGRVEHVLAGAEATRFLGFAESALSQQLVKIQAGAAGIATTSSTLLDRSRSAAAIVLDGVESAPVDGSPEEAMETLAARAAVLVAADSLGAMQRMLDLAVAYSLQRQQFGVPIGSFQAMKHAAAMILVDVEAARSAIYFTAASVDARKPAYQLQAAAVKAQVTAAAVRAADSTLTMFGAIGYTWEHDLHHFYKRAKLNAHLFGTASSWNDLIADSLELTSV
jgi:alkylation response protein AidB-like acyl-CoA dehydrogenase